MRHSGIFGHGSVAARVSVRAALTLALAIASLAVMGVRSGAPAEESQ